MQSQFSSLGHLLHVHDRRAFVSHGMQDWSIRKCGPHVSTPGQPARPHPIPRSGSVSLCADVAGCERARSAAPIPGGAHALPPSVHSVPETDPKSGPNFGGKRSGTENVCGLLGAPQIFCESAEGTRTVP